MTRFIPLAVAVALIVWLDIEFSAHYPARHHHKPLTGLLADAVAHRGAVYIGLLTAGVLLTALLSRKRRQGTGRSARQSSAYPYGSQRY